MSTFESEEGERSDPDHLDAMEEASERNRPCACERMMRSHKIFVKFSQIRRGSKNSCRLCGILEDAILAVVDGKLPNLLRGPRDEAERTSRLDETIIRNYWSDPTKDIPIFPMFSIMGRKMYIKFFTDANEHVKLRIQGFKVLEEIIIGPQTNSERGFRRARHWLHECLEEHHCGEPGPCQAPSRLLDVRGDQVRLFEAQGVKEPYVCLSHCWGGPEHKRLASTVLTIRQHMQSIPWQDLPRTFQDAIETTRRMGIDYLWIDSLCILQEFDGMTDVERQVTKKDFAQENSAMASIYRNSHFTISADISTSMESGLFSKPIDGHRMTVTGDSGEVASLYIRSVTWSSDGPETPRVLGTRGWTFQESLLPPRLLAFEQFELSWRCRETRTCECEHITSSRNSKDHLARIAAKPFPKDLGNATQWWETVVHKYTARELTNGHDKLPALSGLAQVYHQATGDTYLAGLWTRTILHDLCWYHALETSPGTVLFGRLRSGIGRKPRSYRAPSWSWASIDALNNANCCFWSYGDDAIHPVKPRGIQRPACEMHHVLCQPKTSDATGGVQEGSFIEVDAILIGARVSSDPKDQMKLRAATQDFNWTINNVGDGSDVAYCMPDCKLEEDGLADGDEIYCVPILEALTDRGSQRGCLILKQIKRQEYQRIGFCILSKRDPDLSDQERAIITAGMGLRRQGKKFPERDVETLTACGLQRIKDAGVRVKIV